MLVCRAAYASVCLLFPTQPDCVIAIDFSPYEWPVPSAELFVALKPVLRQAEGQLADLFIAGEHQPTWFTWMLAAQLKPQRAIQVTHAKGARLTSIVELRRRVDGSNSGLKELNRRWPSNVVYRTNA